MIQCDKCLRLFEGGIPEMHTTEDEGDEPCDGFAEILARMHTAQLDAPVDRVGDTDPPKEAFEGEELEEPADREKEEMEKAEQEKTANERAMVEEAEKVESIVESLKTLRHHINSDCFNPRVRIVMLNHITSIVDKFGIGDIFPEDTVIESDVATSEVA